MKEQQIQQLQQQIEQLKQAHLQELKKVQFEYMLSLEIYKSKGRNTKAICALLDLENLQNSQEPEKEIALALEQLQQQTPYLFEKETLPIYAGGTATQPPRETQWQGLRAAFGLSL